ncbi:MAG: T9SS type A sorting domain-containing protein, partial [Bacteroidales bacterium]|nr:T9SS type A sorting domain-containing protein [Bacteroidales bacterium]
FTQYSSCCWLSDDDLLVFGTLSPNDNLSRSIALLDVNLSGGVPRLDTVLAEPVLPYRIASNKYNCATFVNDTTIYGSYYSSENLNGPDFPSICLFDKDMEILGNKVFLDEEYTNHPSYFILPQNDGGCILVTLYTLSNHMTQGKLIKMNREDFNPIPCSVEEVPQEAVKALVYPNPAMEKVTIEGIEAAEVQVYNAIGQVVKTVRGTNEVDLSGLAEGVYLVRITDENGKSHAVRVVVK